MHANVCVCVYVCMRAGLRGKGYPSTVYPVTLWQWSTAIQRPSESILAWYAAQCCHTACRRLFLNTIIFSSVPPGHAARTTHRGAQRLFNSTTTTTTYHNKPARARTQQTRSHNKRTHTYTRTRAPVILYSTWFPMRFSPPISRLQRARRREFSAEAAIAKSRVPISLHTYPAWSVRSRKIIPFFFFQFIIHYYYFKAMVTTISSECTRENQCPLCDVT